jgi:hypothetical protein
MATLDFIRKWVQSETPPLIMHIYEEKEVSMPPIIDWDLPNNLITIDHINNKFNMLAIVSKLPPPARVYEPPRIQAKVLDCTISIIVIIISCLIIAHLFKFAIEAILIAATLATFGISVVLDEFLKATTIKNSGVSFDQEYIGKIYDPVITILIDPLKCIELTILLHTGVSLSRTGISPETLLSFWESLEKMNISADISDNILADISDDAYISAAIDIFCKNFDMKSVKLMTLRQKKMLLFIFAYSTLFIEEVEIEQLDLYDDDNVYYTPWDRFIAR